jgi:chromosomal replication initiator protein
VVSGVFSIEFDEHGGVSSTASPEASTAPLRDFIAGAENRLLGEAARAAIDGDKQFFPLLVHGSSGSGKTHLLQGLAGRWSQQSPAGRWRVVTGADFAREFADAVQLHTVDEFQNTYQQLDRLMIDNLDELAGKETAQGQLVMILDHLHERENAFVVVSARVDPLTNPAIVPALASRLSGGLTTPLAPLSRETRMAVLEKLAAAHGIELPAAARRLLSEDSAGLTAVPQLYQALLQLDDYARKKRQLVHADLVSQFLRERHTLRQPNPASIAATVAEHFGLRESELRGPSRRRGIVKARGVAMLLIRTLTNSSLDQIGRFFGGRDHTTVLHAIRRTESAADPEINEALESIGAYFHLH